MRLPRKSAVILALFSLSVAGCKKTNDGPAVATVNGDSISAKEFQSRLAGTPVAYRQYSASASGQEQFLKLLIREKILLQEAKKAGLQNDRSYKDALKSFRDDIQRREKEYEDSLLVDSFIRKLRTSTLAVSDADVRQYYDAHATEYLKPMAVQVSHILVSTPQEADLALQRLKSGEPFETVARQMSKDPATAVRGGKLDPVVRGQLVPEFEDVAFKLKTGETSGPVKTQFGYHIIRKIGEKTLPPQPFEAAQAQIRNRLEKDKFDQWMENRRAAAKIDVKSAALQMPAIPQEERPAQ